MRRKYSHFADLVSAAAARELGFLILSAEYTKGFSTRLKKIIDELDESERGLASVSVMFNTEGEIAIIDESLVGRFVSIKFKNALEEYYRSVGLNKIVKAVMEGGEKRTVDFLSLCYDVLYDTLEEMYKDVKCKREVVANYKSRYNISSYNKEDTPVVTAVLMILEDIISYIGIKESYILTISALKVRKSFSQSF
jgi:NAD(P)H-dependent FMN reductase